MRLFFILFAVLCITAPIAAHADRDHDEHHDWHHYEHHDYRRTVVVRPRTITIWPDDAYSRHTYYAPPTEVSMSCPNGKGVTIRAMGLTLDQMLHKANDYCLAQSGGNLYRVDILSGNRYCREYQSAITVGRDRQSAYGRACLQPDGSWEIVD